MLLKVEVPAYKPNFRAIVLTDEHLGQSSKIYETLLNPDVIDNSKTSSQLDLYKIFNPYIQNEARKKSRFRYAFEEVVAEFNLKFFELLNNINKYPTLEAFIKELNHEKSLEYLKNPEYLNLDENAYRNKEKVKKIDLVTEKDLPNPESAVDIERHRNRLDRIIEEAPITEIQKKRMKMRSKALNYREIAIKEGVSASTAYASVQQSIHKIQYYKNKLPPDIIEQVKTFSKILKCDAKDLVQTILKTSALGLLTMDPETVKNNVEESVKLLGCTFEEFVQAGLKQPSLFYQAPSTLFENAKESAKLLCCSFEEFVQAGLIQPQLFQLKPKKIHRNVKRAVRMLGCPFEKFVQAGLKQPELFQIKISRLHRKVKKGVKLLGCSHQDFVKAGLKKPTLFLEKSRTLFKNAQKSSELFGCSFEDFVKAGLKQGNLLYQAPLTLFNNAQDSVKLLGCTFEEFVQAGLKQPQLFVMKPETILNNVNGAVELIGCTFEEFVQDGLKQPQMFCMKPETLSKKLKLENYYRKIQNKPASNRIIRFDSDKKVYSKILGVLIKNVQKDAINNVNDYKLEEFLKCNSDKSFSLKIPKGEVVEDFIKYIQEISVKIIGKNIFKFKII